MEIRWTDDVRNEEVLQITSGDRTVLHTTKRSANWIGDILHRNCLLKHIIEGNMGGIEVTGIQGRRHKQLLDDRKERREYCKLKEEALTRTQWRIRCRRGCGPVVRQTAE
jgi:hypothetical protein